MPVYSIIDLLTVHGQHLNQYGWSLHVHMGTILSAQFCIVMMVWQASIGKHHNRDSIIISYKFLVLLKYPEL